MNTEPTPEQQKLITESGRTTIKLKLSGWREKDFTPRMTTARAQARTHQPGTVVKHGPNDARYLIVAAKTRFMTQAEIDEDGEPWDGPHWEMTYRGVPVHPTREELADDAHQRNLDTARRARDNEAAHISRLVRDAAHHPAGQRGEATRRIPPEHTIGTISTCIRSMLGTTAAIPPQTLTLTTDQTVIWCHRFDQNTITDPELAEAVAAVLAGGNRTLAADVPSTGGYMTEEHTITTSTAPGGAA